MFVLRKMLKTLLKQSFCSFICSFIKMKMQERLPCCCIVFWDSLTKLPKPPIIKLFHKKKGALPAMDSVKHVLVVAPVTEDHRKRLVCKFPSLQFTFTTPSEATDEQIAAADAVFGNLTPARIQASERLRLLQLNSAGADGYIIPGVLHKDTALANATGAYGLTISEHMMGLLLMLYKKLYLYRDYQANCVWGEAGSVKTLQGAAVLVLGAGNIGTEFAKRVKGFGAYVIGVRRTEGELPSCYDEVHLVPELDSLLPRADVVAMSLPGTPETRHIIDEHALSLMKDDAVLINVGRGSAVDGEALCDAMEQGKLWGAALDVTEPEPLPPEHRMWKIPNLLITPHAAGGFHLELTLDYIVGIFERNLTHLLNGEPFENLVDFQTGYRKK